MIFFIPSYRSYLNISQAVLPLWIFKVCCKDYSLLQALNPKAGGTITLSTQIKSLVPELFSGWQLFTLQFLIWKSCATIRFYQSCFYYVEFILFFSNYYLPILVQTLHYVLRTVQWVSVPTSPTLGESKCRLKDVHAVSLMKKTKGGVYSSGPNLVCGDTNEDTLEEAISKLRLPKTSIGVS